MDDNTRGLGITAKALFPGRDDDKIRKITTLINSGTGEIEQSFYCEETFMKIKDKIIIAALVVILIFQFVLNSNMKRLNNELTGRVDSLKSTVIMMQGNVSSEVNSIMNRIHEENSVIKSVEWDPVEMKDGLVTVECAACFNQITAESFPYLLYKSKISDKWYKIKLEHEEGLNYSAKIDLKPQESYSYQIFIDGETRYSGNTEEIASYIYKYTDFRGMILGGYDHRNDNTKTHITINMEPISKVTFKPLQIESAEVVLYNSGRMLGNVIMQSGDRITGNDAKPEYYVDNASVEVRSENMTGILSANLDMGSYKEAIDKITVKVTYNDGYIVEKEVYPKTEE